MLVTLEGLDGSGKSTLADGLRERFPGATFTREPTDSWYGDAVYRSLRADDADPLAELYLYTADHADHLARLVRPALEGGTLVISDRYSDSRYAYQGASLDRHPGYEFDDPVAYVRSVHAPFTRVPDLTIYLDLPPDLAAERAAAANKFERGEFLADVAKNYERLFEDAPARFVRVDATRPPGEVLSRAAAAIEART